MVFSSDWCAHPRRARRPVKPFDAPFVRRFKMPRASFAWIGVDLPGAVEHDRGAGTE